MAGVINDSYGGANLVADYLYPYRRPCIRCGPLCMSTATADSFTTTNLVVTGTVTMDYVPYIPGPDNHIWVPLGPMVIPAGPTPSTFVQIPLAAGSWYADLTLVGTGTVPADFSHSEIRFSMISTGTAVTVVTTSATFQVLNGAMLTTPPTIAIVGNSDNMQINITSFENSKWVGYIKLVGAGVYGS